MFFFSFLIAAKDAADISIRLFKARHFSKIAYLPYDSLLNDYFKQLLLEDCLKQSLL